MVMYVISIYTLQLCHVSLKYKHVMHALECIISDNRGSVSWAQYIMVDSKCHIELPGEAEIVINFTVEVHKAQESSR